VYHKCILFSHSLNDLVNPSDLSWSLFLVGNQKVMGHRCRSKSFSGGVGGVCVVFLFLFLFFPWFSLEPIKRNVNATA